MISFYYNMQQNKISIDDKNIQFMKKYFFQDWLFKFVNALHMSFLSISLEMSD